MHDKHWQGGAWWVNPALWVDGADSATQRPTETDAISQIRQQSEERRLPLLRVIVTLERWYYAMHPEVVAFVRMQLIARRLDMTMYQVSDALTEAHGLMEAGRW